MGAKFGDRSCALCTEVIITDAFKASAIVMKVKQTYGLSPTNVIQARKHPGIKCAAKHCTVKSSSQVENFYTTYRILKTIFL